MRETFGENQFIQHEQVISHYYRIRQDEMEEVFKSFLERLLSQGYTPSAPLFYSINSGVLADGKIIMQVFLPVNEANQGHLPEGFLYQTYFQVLDMVATRVIGKDESAISQGLVNLSRYIRVNGYKEMTPVFYCVSVDNDTTYTDIMVGILD